MNQVDLELLPLWTALVLSVGYTVGLFYGFARYLWAQRRKDPNHPPRSTP